jgi:hypothetical protein
VTGFSHRSASGRKYGWADYLRPAPSCVPAFLAKGDNRRFGWHNFRKTPRYV